LSPELHRIKALFPEHTIVEMARPFYDLDLGRPSEDPVLLTKILFLSFFYAVAGDEKTLETLTYRMDWRQLWDLPLDAPIPDRSTLVKFRRHVGLVVIEGMFRDFLETLVKHGLIDLSHRFFDGTPGQARARLNPDRDEVSTETLAAIDDKLKQFQAQQVAIDPPLNPTPVELTKPTYAADHAAVDARRAQGLQPGADRHSAGDPEARFQRGKQGKSRALGDEIFLSTDGKQLFSEDVQVSAAASQGQQLFLDKLEQSAEGQSWRVDAEFATGEILEKAEEKGVTLNTPPRQGTSHGRVPKTEFTYTVATATYPCPQGQTLSHRGTNHNLGERHDRPAPGTCDACPLRGQCPTSKTGRTVTRQRDEAQWERQREHARTPEAVMGKVLRGIIAEGKFAEAVRHGLKIMRYGGKPMAVLQSILVALILNVKRLLRVEAQGIVT
jgi:transposase